MGLDVAYLKVDGMSTSTGLIAGGAVVPNGATNATTTFKSVGNEDI